MTETTDPREQFRQLPERVLPEDVVETSAAETPRVVENPAEIHLRVLRGGGGGG